MRSDTMLSTKSLLARVEPTPDKCHPSWGACTQDILLIVTTSWQNFANVKETSRRAAEMPLMRGLWLLRPRTSSLKVAIKVKLRLTGVNNSIIIFVDQSSRSFILGMFSVLSLKSRLPELGQDTRRSTTMSSLGVWHCCEY